MVFMFVTVVLSSKVVGGAVVLRRVVLYDLVV